MLGKRFRSRSSLAGPRISPLAAKYGCPRPSLRIMAFVRPTLVGNRRGRRSSSTIPCLIVPAIYALAWSTSICSRSTSPTTGPSPGSAKGRTDRRARPTPPTDARGKTRCRGRGGAGRRPTTSFLTATTLIYAIGAGITAGAGTRLVLRSILARAFASRSFRTPDPVKGAPPR